MCSLHRKCVLSVLAQSYRGASSWSYAKSNGNAASTSVCHCGQFGQHFAAMSSLHRSAALLSKFSSVRTERRCRRLCAGHRHQRIQQRRPGRFVSRQARLSIAAGKFDAFPVRSNAIGHIQQLTNSCCCSAPKLCRDECELLEHDVCSMEFTLAKLNPEPELKSLLPSCSSLPRVGEQGYGNCLRIGVTQDYFSPLGNSSLFIPKTFRDIVQILMNYALIVHLQIKSDAQMLRGKWIGISRSNVHHSIWSNLRNVVFGQLALDAKSRIERIAQLLPKSKGNTGGSLVLRQKRTRTVDQRIV